MKHNNSRHSLPTSNGFSGGSNGITVWCGRCKDSFEPDEDWAIRYIEMIQRDVGKKVLVGGYYGLTQEKAEDIVNGYEDQFRSAGLIT